MVRHLVSLKLALLRGGLKRGGKSAVVALVVALVIASSLGGLFGLALLSLRSATAETSADVLAAVFAVLLVGWALGPLMALASDNTLDIDRLSLFPLSARQLMPGLLVSAAVGPGGVFTMLVLGGAFLGTAPTHLGAVTVAVALALVFLLCMATSRLVSTALSAATSKRRWRDVALFVGPLLALVANAGFQILNRRVFDESGRVRADTDSYALTVARRVLRWLPTGWPAQAVHGAMDGSFVLPVLGLVLTAGVVVAVAALWWRSIQAATTNPGTAGRGRKAARAELPSRRAWWSPRTALGAIVAKELRYMWREPRRRASMLGLLAPALFPLLRQNPSAAGPRFCLVAALPILTAGANSNLFGFDADRYWVDVVACVPTRVGLAGRTLARWVVTVPFGIVLLIGLAVLTGSADGVVPALGMMAAVLGVASGYSAIASIRTPFPMPDAGRGNVFGSGGAGGGSAAGAASLAVVFGTMATVSPLLIATLVLPATSPAQVAVALLGVALGVAAWLVGLRIATPTEPSAEADLLFKLTRV